MPTHTHACTTTANDTPTPTRLAGLIESTLVQAEPHIQFMPTLNWMLSNGPAASALLEEITRTREDSPTLLQFAALLLTFKERPFDGAYESILWITDQTQEGQAAHAELQSMIEDSADVVNERFPLNVVQAHQDVDRLLATEFGDDPATIVDPRRDNISLDTYREWTNILAARLARGVGDAERIRIVMAKIARCVERHDDTTKILEIMSRFDDLGSIVEILEHAQSGKLTARAA